MAIESASCGRACGRSVKRVARVLPMRLTAAAKPIHKQLPSFAERLPSDSLSILFFAMTKSAIEMAQAIHETSEAIEVQRKAMISIARLLQHQAMKANRRVTSANPAAGNVKHCSVVVGSRTRNK